MSSWGTGKDQFFVKHIMTAFHVKRSSALFAISWPHIQSLRLLNQNLVLLKTQNIYLLKVRPVLQKDALVWFQWAIMLFLEILLICDLRLREGNGNTFTFMISK